MGDETKEVRVYTVITGEGYWGKGATAAEAAKEANVGASWVSGTLYHADQYLVKGEIECSNMGGAAWTWTDKVTDLPGNIKECLKEGLCSAGKLKVSKGKLIIQREVK